LGAIKVDYLYNGYDELDFEGIEKIESNKIIISHIGSFNEERNKDLFWKTIKELTNNKVTANIEIRLVGNVVKSVVETVEKHKLSSYVKFTGNISHKESLQEMVNSDVLLLFLGDLSDRGRIPSKVFEYIVTGNKIFALASKESDIGQILKNKKQAVVTEKDYYKIKEVLIESKKSAVNLDEFSREKIAGKMKQIIEEL
jgi:glycosyltransferase involved in cell wall biosynthesis